MFKLKALFAVFMTLLIVAAAGPAEEQGRKTKPQTTCPVMGRAINKQYFSDYKGMRVYFCCAGCPAEFKKSPEKFIKKLEDAGVTIERAPVPQTRCPVMEGTIDRQIYADYDGKRVYFCCAGCLVEFRKDPAKYVKKLMDAGVTLEKSPAKQAE